MRHRMEFRVRFSDTDLLGHVNNASYFTYIEEARCQWIEQLAWNGIPLIIASAKVDFRAQSFYPETLAVESWVERIGNSSFDVASRVFRPSTGETVFEGVVVIVHFDYERQRAAPLSERMRADLTQYLDSQS